jgi:hypothetical protein
MGRRKESNMFNLVNQQTPKRNIGDRKEQIVLDELGEKTEITKISKYLSIMAQNVNVLPLQ